MIKGFPVVQRQRIHLPIQEMQVQSLVRKIPWRRDPLQNSCLENPMDRGAWRAKSIGSPSQTLLRGLACTHLYV